MIARSDSIRQRIHWSVRIEDFGRIKFSPWFSSRGQCVDWLNSDETKLDHRSRFLDPVYSIEQYAESEILPSRDLYCVDFEYPARNESGVWQ